MSNRKKDKKDPVFRRGARINGSRRMIAIVEQGSVFQIMSRRVLKKSHFDKNGCLQPTGKSFVYKKKTLVSIIATCDAKWLLCLKELLSDEDLTKKLLATVEPNR